MALGGILTLGLRLSLGLLMLAAWHFAGRWFQPALLDLYAQQTGLTAPSSPLGQAIFGVWARWDAIHLLRLAELGYQGAGVGSSAFYPMYPFLTGGFARLSGLSVLTSSLLLSSLFTWSAFSCLHQLAWRRLEADTALWATLALAVFPTAFFLIGPFTESLFLTLTIGALLAAYQRKWWLAGAMAALGSITRGPGLLIAIPLGWIGWQAWLQSREKALVPTLAPAIAASFAAVLPGFGFQLWRHSQGFPPLVQTLQTYSRQQFVGPSRGLLLAIEQLFRGFEYLPWLEFSFMLLFAVLTIFLLRKPGLRQPEWILFQGANLLLFMSFNSFEASAWRSMARYVLSLFPGFLAMGYWLSSQAAAVRFIVMVISTSLLLIFSSLFALFWFFG
jgi:hypothetical protein